MVINFLDPETTSVSNRFEAAKKTSTNTSAKKAFAKIDSSDDVSGIEIRMLPPLIKDNGTPAVWPFPGYARFYCLTIVVSDVDNQLAGNIDLKGFQRIGDNEHLPINKTIFYWQSQTANDKAPNQIHVMCSIIKSKKDLREVGNILSSVKSDGNYQTLIGTLKNVAKNAAKFAMVTDIITQIAGIVGGYLGKVEDKPLATVINSYTTIHGDFDKIGISPLAYPTRNADFHFHLVVRDAAAVKTLVIAGAKNTASKAARSSIKNLAKSAEKELVVVDMMPL